jgi:hypothetical protein
MQRYKIALCLLLLPVRAHADFAAQQNNVSIKAAAYKADEPVIEYTEYYRVNIKGSDFVSKSLKPVWIEISNNSENQIEIAAQPAVDHDLVEKSVLLKKFKNGWKVWTALFCLTIAPYVDFGCLYFYLEAKVKRETLSEYWYWDSFRMDFLTRLSCASMGFVAWCGAYGYNATLESGIDSSLLEGNCLIMPGEKMRKVVVLDGADQFILSVINPGADEMVQYIEVQI